MRQLTLAANLCLSRSSKTATADGGDALIRLVAAEEDLAFHAVVPHGNILKSVAELLVRCTPQIPVTVDQTGIVFVACDPASGRLIRVHLHAADLLHFRFFLGGVPLRATLEATSLHATCYQLKRKDAVVLYATTAGQFGSLVDYSGRQDHTKHATICVRQTGGGAGLAGPPPDPPVPTGYHGPGVPVPSSILQRILREYKSLSKRIIVTGNASYIHLSADARVSLHRSDNLFGVLDAREDDVTVELSIATLGRVLKVTQFSPYVHIACDPGLPVRLTATLGRCGSRADIYIQQDPTSSSGGSNPTGAGMS